MPPSVLPHPSPVPPRPWRALLFALVGYVYIAAVFGAMVGLTLLLAWLGARALIWIPISLILGILITLWVRFAAPEGRRITREEAPALFRAIDRARGQLRAPEVDVVVLTTELNAGVMETPRFGLSFFPVRYLTLGLPLLHLLAEDELHATLAHEFAHLSRQHGRLRRWLVRASATWTGLGVGTQASGSILSPLIVPFFRWYAPRLDRLMQATSRAHEHESDRLSTRAAGPDAAVRSLLRLEVGQQLVARSAWPAILRDSAEHPAPTADVFPRLLRSIETLSAQPGLREVVRDVLRDRTLNGDSHPSCAERLEAAGARVDAPDALADALAVPRVPAVEVLLEPGFAEAVRRELGAAWNQEVQRQWAGCHADARVWREAESAEDGPALWARARWSVDCEPEASLPLLRRVLAVEPGHAEASVQLGVLLLRAAAENAQAEGVALLEREAARSSRMALVATGVLQQHYARAGNDAEVSRMQARAQALDHEALQSLRERQDLRARDTLRPYPLPQALRAEFVRALKGHLDVRAAFLVQKRTRYLDQSPQVVLAVHITGPWYRPMLGSHGRVVCEALLEKIHLPDSLDLLIMPVESRSAVLRRLRRLPGAEIYRRRGAPAPAADSAAWSEPAPLTGRVTLAGMVWGIVVLGLVFGVLARWQERGEQPQTVEEWRRALPGLVQAAREDTHDADAQEELAQGLMMLERWKDAEPAMERASRLTPGRADRLNTLGWLRVRMGEPARALEPLRRAVELAPDDASARHNLGWAFYELGRYPEAEHWYRGALRLNADDPHVNADLGLALMRLDRLEEAERQFVVAVSLDDADAELLRYLAEAQRRRRRLQASIATLHRAAVLAPGEAETWAELGHSELMTGDFAAADSAFVHAARLDPTYFRANPGRRILWAAARDRLDGSDSSAPPRE